MLLYPRSHRPAFALGALAMTLALVSTTAEAQIRITEVMSLSNGGTADWFEVTNYGLSSLDPTGFRMDDNSFNFANSALLEGITSIAAGESVVYLESALGADIPAFRTFWGGSATTAQIGFYSGSGVSFSSNGDGVVVFNAAGVEQTPQTSFGSAVATPGQSFYWAYDAAGDFVTGFGSASAGIVSTPGSVPGSLFAQTTFTSTDALGNIGSPGTAAVAVPEPSTMALAAGGLCLAGMAARRRMKS